MKTISFTLKFSYGKAAKVNKQAPLHPLWL
jgi:hypothetical protein